MICGKWFRHKSNLASNRYTFKSHTINKHGNSGPEMLHFEKIFLPMHYAKKDELNFYFQGEPLKFRGSDGTMYFQVLVTKVAY